MDHKANTLRKAVESVKGRGEHVLSTTEREQEIIEKSRDRYKAFLNSVNRTSDRDIERAMRNC
ncbi:hypothetical protein GOZ90_09640 [Agrobacterium vitis]|uniref:Uncharacterized protein n=1 Tax=Agrobacterium vitis TaxID=373 RepID=A0A6L6VB26_AGRVI|nr:hypothetical protein [Agrobacterium vitis]MUZ72944.1 hypothetical protein [Agrobacterium vitis]